MTQDKPLVPPGTDTSATEEAPRPDEDRPTAWESAPAPERANAASAAAMEEKNTGEPSAPAGITFAGTAGTAPVHTLPETVERSTDASTGSPLRKSSSSRTPAAPPPPSRPGPAENSFRAMSFAALLFLAVLLLFQTAAGIYFPALYLPAETAAAGAAAATPHFGLWLTPAMADQTAMLPGYFWFLGGVNALLHLMQNIFPSLGPLPAETIVFSLASCIAAFVALAGTYALGKAVGFGRQAAFAAGLLLLSCLGFTPLAHFLSPDLLLAGVLGFALACLYKGWTNERAFVRLTAGFLLTGLATLLGGLTGLLIPLVTSFLFLCWRGTLRRGNRPDALLGFGVMLLIVLGWMGAVILFTEEGPYMRTLAHQVLAPLTPPLWPPQDPWWMPAALLCLALFPWFLILLFVSWGRVLARAWTDFKASRAERSGAAWLWISLIFGLVLLTAYTTKPWLAVVPLLPAAALLLGKALLRLSPRNSRLFFLLLAVCFLLAGLGLGISSLPFALETLLPYLPEPLPAVLKAAAGLPVLAAICVVAALVLWKLTDRAWPGGSLAVTVLLITILAQPAMLMLSPSLEGIVGQRLPASPDAAAIPATPEAREIPSVPPAASATPLPTGAAPAPADIGKTTAPEIRETPSHPQTTPEPEVTPPAASTAPDEDMPADGAPPMAVPPSVDRPSTPDNTPPATAPEPQPAL